MHEKVDCYTMESTILWEVTNIHQINQVFHLISYSEYSFPRIKEIVTASASKYYEHVPVVHRDNEGLNQYIYFTSSFETYYEENKRNCRSQAPQMA